MRTIRAYYIQQRSIPRPPEPQFYDWHPVRKRFAYTSAGWHSKLERFDEDKQECYYSDLKFDPSKPHKLLHGGRVWLLTDDKRG